MKQGSWQSTGGFLLAAVGSAIGIGNLWRFPALCANYGGGTFIIVFLALLIPISLPLMLAEFSLGQKGGGDIPHCFAVCGRSKAWGLLGLLPIGAAFLVLAVYLPVGGWISGFMLASLRFAPPAADYFSSLSLISPYSMALLWGFLLLIALTIGRGLTEGVEKLSKLLIPILFLLLCGLAVYACCLPNSDSGLKMLFSFNPDLVNSELLTVALGQVFYSLSLGMGINIAYGAFLPPRFKLRLCATLIAAFAACSAILSSFIIIPAATAFNLPLQAGTSLLFVSLPHIFCQIGGLTGAVFSALFFFLAFIAAYTSACALLEVCAAPLLRVFKRPYAVAIAALTVGAAGTLQAASFAAQGQIFSAFDNWAAHILMPAAAWTLCLFAGLVWREGFGKITRFMLAFILPVLILICLML
ncbi:MAG: sodium-dependent transporter [Clostridia bacterium]|nr:sodium-dependent transporter [Clostridia bacterium]